MSIVKDLLLLSLFLFIIIKYILLYRNLIKQRQYFIDTLSHDLRVSAIAQIRGLDLLQKNSCQNELIIDLNDSCRFSLEMINMLLNTYRFEKGEQFLDCESFNLSELINKSCQSSLELSKNKKIEIYKNTSEKDIIEAEKAGIYKVLTTLVATAIYNSSKNSIIEIKTTKTNKNYKINIVYQGKPLSEEECRRMFDNNPRFSMVGQGIKMQLIKKIIDFHNGKICVKNINNKYNSFTLVLPESQKKIFSKPPILSTLQTYRPI